MGKAVYRAGTASLPRLRGARRECDPGALPPERFRDVINARFVGPELASRGGQEKVTTGDPLEGCIVGIFPAEYQDGDDTSLLILSGRAGNVSSLELVHAWDGLVLTQLENAREGRIKSWYSDEQGLYCSTGAVAGDGTPPELRRFVVGAGGVTDVTVVGSDAGLDDNTFGGITRFQGEIHVTFSRFLSGTSERERGVMRLTEDGDFVQDYYDLTILGLAGEELLAIGLNSDAERVWAVTATPTIRSKGADGVWQEQASSAGGAFRFDTLRTVQNQRADGDVVDSILIGTYAGVVNIISYFPGSIVGAPHTATDIQSVLTSDDEPMPMAYFNGDLYYGWKDGANVRVGRRRQGAFTDSFHTFTGAETITDLIVYKGRLYALRGDTLESTADGTTWQTDQTLVDGFYRAAVAF